MSFMQPTPLLEASYNQSWNFEERLEEGCLLSTPSSGTTSPLSESSSANSNLVLQDSPVSSISSSRGYFSCDQDDEIPVVAIIGIGYVGFHLLTAFSKYFKVVAFDVSEERLHTVKNQLHNTTNITLTTNMSLLALATHILVAVPTPLIPGTTNTDTSIIRQALDMVSNHVRMGVTIVIESSVSVGMTRSLLTDMVKTYNLRAGMSPERVDPGRMDPPYERIPKIISGLDDIAPGSLKSIEQLYSRVFENIVLVSSPEVAEMTKLYENCQRMVCIAYANEMSDACQRLTRPIDPFEVSRAAATKPFGYLNCTPSAGVGGHCIPVNPSYLFNTCEFPLLRHATQKMTTRPAALADRAMRKLKEKRYDMRSKFKPTVLVVGIAFKSGQALTTNSPAVGIINRLLDTWEAHVSYADPLVPEEALPYVPKLDDSQEWNRERLSQFDAVIVVIKQIGLDFDVLKGLDEVMIEQYCQ